MYAQLCKRLSEEAPNLEPPPQPCTFKLLLLNKCRTEFENRAQAFAAYDERASLTPDEEEKRHLAKCKMLGNIKFIGELGKLEILSESILHRCIQNLLARRAAAEHHEDLECLAQLVRTCGRVLDSERGKRLMDQYFARIETLSASRELAPRIRFMLRDVAELRRGGWVPRAATAGEGPVPIQQLRQDEEPPRRDREPLFRRQRPLDDMLAGLSMAAPAQPTPPDKLFGNGFGGRQRSAPGYFRGRDNKDSYKQQQGGNNNKETAPRFNKTRLAASPALEDVQMRPAANSLLFTANRLSKPSAQTQPMQPVQTAVLAPAFTSAPPLVKEPAITIKPATDKKEKPKKEKGLNKEEVSRVAVEAATDAAATAGDAEEAAAAAAARLAALQLPDKLQRRAAAALLEHALQDTVSDEVARMCVLVTSAMRRGAGGGAGGAAGGAALDALRTLLQSRHPHPRLARLFALAVHHKLIPLSEAGAAVEGAPLYPLLLEVLQELLQLGGMEALQQRCHQAKVDICAYVRACLGAETSEAELAEAVESRGLTALAPALRLQGELARQLHADPAPAALYRWIKGHVEPAVRAHRAFVSALVGALVAHITRASDSAGGAPARGALEQERALAEAYAPLLTAIVTRAGDAQPNEGEPSSELQLAAVYALQVFAHGLQYPRGLLLRWFMYLYSLEVCEEEAFLRWREDVTDAYPGKGQALFQVNTWLTWLQQQESEDEEGED